MISVQHLARSTALVLAGCALGSLAVGAARPNGPPGEMRLGDIGMHRGQEDSLIFNFKGRDYRIRYVEWVVPQKHGFVQYQGTVYAAPWAPPDRIEEKLEAQGERRRGSVVGPRFESRSRGPARGPADARSRASRD